MNGDSKQIVDQINKRIDDFRDEVCHRFDRIESCVNDKVTQGACDERRGNCDISDFNKFKWAVIIAGIGVVFDVVLRLIQLTGEKM